MADPAPYEVAYSFANFQSNNPADPLPGTQVDNELAGVETAVAALVDAVKDVRRSDGGLKNGIVTVDSLSAGVLAGLADLDEDAAAAVDAAIALVQSDIEAQLAVLDAEKADLVHTHAATAVSISAIAGIVGATVQAALAELRALGPQTGDFRLSLDDTVRSGEVACNDGTIGDATSGASNRADDDTQALYEILWNNVSDTYAPVTTGRGLSATADFAAHKSIALTKMLGRALGVAGAGATLTSRALGVTVGAETHTLTIAQLPTVTPAGTVTITDPDPSFGGADAGAASFPTVSASNNNRSSNLTWTASFTGTPFGSGSAHPIMQPTAFSLHAFLKL